MECRMPYLEKISFCRTPNLDLPDELFNEIKSSVEQNKIIRSWFHETRNTGEGWFNQLLFKYCFKQGWFYIHKLESELEQKVLDHYAPFCKLLGHTPKVRLKIAYDVRRLPPHSDASTGGDTSSIVTLIKGNNEITSWYNAEKDFKSTAWNLLRLKKIASTCLESGSSHLFNNARVHSVTNCRPHNTRYLLAVSWQNVSYAELEKTYQSYAN